MGVLELMRDFSWGPSKFWEPGTKAQANQTPYRTHRMPKSCLLLLKSSSFPENPHTACQTPTAGAHVVLPDLGGCSWLLSPASRKPMQHLIHCQNCCSFPGRCNLRVRSIAPSGLLWNVRLTLLYCFSFPSIFTSL